ncbi:hypothetical protein F5B20DRAFT_571901 [Whalleya microplaca]|nr:hypothetical protein F5B20DRAFT_571901 [Whalleya microplaca]
MPENARDMTLGPDLTATTGDQRSTTPGGTGKRHKIYRKRLRLSCEECRNKKLSCDRKLPCQRCVKSGRPEQCSFETKTRPPSVSDTLSVQHNTDEIRELRAEVTQLRILLSKATLQCNETDSQAHTLRDESSQPVLLNKERDLERRPAQPTHVANTKLYDRSPRGYYRQHTLFQFFVEIPQLFPFIQETADEWFKPRGVSLSKGKSLWNKFHFPEEGLLDELLPPKDHTDALISFYLNHLEQLHRIVHVPTPRYPAMTALILAMMSISTCASSSSSDFTYIASVHRAMPPKWISACEEWLRQQSSKGRKLVYYQISCLVYLAKRMNSIRKKRFWNETGSLIQNAIMDKLHCDPSSTFDSPYMREIKRRIWAVLRELDLQNTFEYELPTLLHNIDSNVAPPTNLDDEDFDEESKEFPISRPLSQYTYTSYQSHSSQTFALRLEISRRLFGTGFPKVLDYDDVLRYTHEITQAVDALPAWNMEGMRHQTAIHRPYLQRGGKSYWLSETVCYHTLRDILTLNSKLSGLGIQSLTLLREDLLIASLSLARITLLQPKDSSSVTMTNAESTIDLLEKCLPFVEERYLRCSYGEPWCPLTMCGAIMLLKIHLGKESRQTAKSYCAQRFLGLYYKHFVREEESALSQPLALLNHFLHSEQPSFHHQGG